MQGLTCACGACVFHIQKSIVQIDNKKYNLNRIEEYKISFFQKGFKNLNVVHLIRDKKGRKRERERY